MANRHTPSPSPSPPPPRLRTPSRNRGRRSPSPPSSRPPAAHLRTPPRTQNPSRTPGDRGRSQSRIRARSRTPSSVSSSPSRSPNRGRDGRHHSRPPADRRRGGRRSSSSSSRSSSSSDSARSSRKPVAKKGKKTELLKQSVPFLGAVALASLAAHRLWPKGVLYGEHDDWEKHGHHQHKKAQEAKDRANAALDKVEAELEEAGGRRDRRAPAPPPSRVESDVTTRSDPLPVILSPRGRYDDRDDRNRGYVDDREIRRRADSDGGYSQDMALTRRHTSRDVEPYAASRRCDEGGQYAAVSSMKTSRPGPIDPHMRVSRRVKEEVEVSPRLRGPPSADDRRRDRNWEREVERDIDWERQQERYVDDVRDRGRGPPPEGRREVRREVVVERPRDAARDRDRERDRERDRDLDGDRDRRDWERDVRRMDRELLARDLDPVEAVEHVYRDRHNLPVRIRHASPSRRMDDY